MDYKTAQQLLQAKGQLHILSKWGSLHPDEQKLLLSDIQAVDWELLDRISTPTNQPATKIEPAYCHPPDVLPATPPPQLQSLYEQARLRGMELIRENRVATLTVAGGQGTRLGFDGPKGCYPITPLRQKSLFQYFAEWLKQAQRRFNPSLRWLIMTGPENHQVTQNYFRQHHFFGLPESSVFFFEQGVMPAISQDGKVLLANSHRLALAPDGHGGTFRALQRSGLLQQLLNASIRYISYFQVDNPLIPPLDPLLIGLTDLQESEFSSKVVRKNSADEKVGVFVHVADQVRVIEYIDLPAEIARALGSGGQRLYDYGNIAAHVLQTDFIRRLTSRQAAQTMPWHQASKKVPYYDPSTNQIIEPINPNAIKFEQFIFDAIPQAQQPLILEVRREEEFSPVKNADGPDSPATCRTHQIERAKRWLTTSHPTFAQYVKDNPQLVLEISPAAALTEEDFKDNLHARRIQLEHAIHLHQQEIYIE